MRKIVFILLISFLGLQAHGQKLKIGVRTGLNFFQLQGPLELSETQNLSSGFHFGINGTYYFNDFFGLRAELLYIQKGSILENDGRFHAVYKLPTGFNAIEWAGPDSKYTLKRTFNTFGLPLQAVIKPIKKIEISAGINIDFVAGTTGQGNIDFANDDPDNFISYLQTLNFNYNTDRAGQFNTNTQTNITILYDTDGDGDVEQLTVPKSVGAYYYETATVDGSLVRSFDLGLNAGISYYINPGLYIRGTVNYGLLDVTNSQYDYSLEEINSDATLIYRDDFDRKVGFQVSVGFQF